jgi:outer membrane receptor for ferrienterochelin and colicins
MFSGYILTNLCQSIDSIHRFKEVEITRKQAPRMLMATQNVELVSSFDLKSDACCNLSESFMRTGAVDVQYSDGVSGAKEIRMLGLDGNYLQTMFENLPGIRGLQNNFGMEHLPATWISSIQINKGAGSVVNGYEAITGQINIELQKPQAADKFFFNAYVNQDARFELNAHIAHQIKDKPWYTLTSAHSGVNWLKLDFNHDGFMDNPLFNRFALLHRWFYIKKDGECLC